VTDAERDVDKKMLRDAFDNANMMDRAADRIRRLAIGVAIDAGLSWDEMADALDLSVSTVTDTWGKD
jgi:hypothetical protein